MGAGILNAEVSAPIHFEAYHKLPLTFEANQGQTDPKVKFLARGDGYGLFLTPTEALLSLKSDAGFRALRLRWEGANPAPRIFGREEQSGKVNYLKGGNPSGWHRNVPVYARVAYESVYPGIDLVFYGNQRRLEHDYVLAPGADPRKIRFTLEGADRIEIALSGELVVHVGGEEVRLHLPVAYQDGKAGHETIQVAYRLIAPGGPGLPEVGFAVGSYDPATALVIDPMLVYSSYLGSYNYDSVSSVAVDAAGNAYFTGITDAYDDFPVTPGAFQTVGHAGHMCEVEGDTFVTKVNPSGALVYSTYLGGDGYENPGGIAVDASGSAYVSGATTSSDFPGFNPVRYSGEDWDAFVAKLDPSGSNLVFSTRLGGHGHDMAMKVALDAAGSVYVAGETRSYNFPTYNAFQARIAGWIDIFGPDQWVSRDLFVTKLTPDGSRILYSTFLGGDREEECRGLTVDSAGHAYVVGTTESQNFPTVHAVRGSLAGGQDGFAAKLHPSGSALVYSTYLGGRETYDVAQAVAVDSQGNAFVAGSTPSPDFPTTSNAAQPILKGYSDGFVTKLASDGSLQYSTFLGGGAGDGFSGVGLFPWGAVVLVGSTSSPDYPLKNPLQTKCSSTEGDWIDGTVTILVGSQIYFSTCLGGNLADWVDTLATGEWEEIFIGGTTYSKDLPTVHALQPEASESLKEPDGFIAKIVLNRPPDCSAAFAAPGQLWPPNGAFVPIDIRGVTEPDGEQVILWVKAVHQDEPLSRRGEADALGLGLWTSPARVRSDRNGNGDGRVYRLSFAAEDERGGLCTGTVTVCVPHDQRPGATCGDGGPLFDSAGQR